jgi:hypothetical protein
MKYLIIILTLCLLVGCQRTKVNTKHDENPNKVFASDYHCTNPKDVCLKQKQLYHKGKFFLKSNQVFAKVTDKDMTIAKHILENLIDSCQKNNNINPKSIDCYFRQYIGYKENDQNYVYINLCAFYNEKSTKSGLIISDCYLNSVLSTPERGYAGHVIINMGERTVSEYHFEKYPES